jgi:CubicO group peptidase (beta-lactamase class C family)
MTLSQRGRAWLRAVMNGYIERGELPGLVTALMYRGETVVEGFGALGVGDRRPMQRDTIFRISSMSKPVLAVAVMSLVEQCKLRLDDSVEPLLPELANRRVLKRVDGPLDDTVSAQRAITLRDLLGMTWGLGQIMADPARTPVLKALIEELNGFGPPQPQKTPAPDEFMRRLGALPLMAQPGTRWLYNTSYDVLGVLIERVSGKSLEQFLRERIFEPLGMRDTGFTVDEAQRNRLCTSYEQSAQGLRVFDEANGQWSHAPAFFSGAGGLLSTATDYLTFAQMLHEGGKRGRVRILARPTVELMRADHLSAAQKSLGGLMPGDFDAVGYGFGVCTVTRRDTAAQLGSYGWDGGLGTFWRNDPRQDLIGILLTQVTMSAPVAPTVCRDFWTLTYAAIDD